MADFDMAAIAPVADTNKLLFALPFSQLPPSPSSHTHTHTHTQ